MLLNVMMTALQNMQPIFFDLINQRCSSVILLLQQPEKLPYKGSGLPMPL